MDAKSDVLNKVAGAIQKANNILVTINRSPSVDQVAAAIGLTFILEQLGKFATAIFSGNLPPATEFLNPDQTFEHNVDVLRDFIITIDKEKVDRVRYKVEGDVVQILVTPYKTTLSADDMNFDNGEYNIDLVIALGAIAQDDLDDAVRGVTRILHDATVVAINNTVDMPSFATIAWNNGDETETSCCEMVADLAEVLGEKEMGEPTATALLTGIISETDQFRNHKTTSKAMQVAARLMGYGANQQLIAVKLDENRNLADYVAPTPEPVAELPVADTEPQPEIESQPETETAAENPIEANGEETPATLSREEILRNINENIQNVNASEGETAAQEAEARLAQLTGNSTSPDTVLNDLANYAPEGENAPSAADLPAPESAPSFDSAPASVPDLTPSNPVFESPTPSDIMPPAPAADSSFTPPPAPIPTNDLTSSGLQMPPDFPPVSSEPPTLPGFNTDKKISEIEDSLPKIEEPQSSPSETIPPVAPPTIETPNTQFRIPGQ